MKNFISLRVLDFLSRGFTALGVEYPLMRRLLQTKLTLDTRRTPTLMAQQNQKVDEHSRFIRSMWMYAFLGLLFMVLIWEPGSPFVGLSVFFGMLMFFLATSMISDFSAVLLDVSDKSILFTKPIKPVTISVARFMHILIYLSILCGSLAGPGIVAVAVKYGPVAMLLMVAALILICVFTVSATSLLYTILLRYYDGEKLKDVINVVQIISVVTVTAGYQLIGRMFRFIDMTLVFTPKWWTFFLPPAWFAAIIDAALAQEHSVSTVSLAIMGVLLPILGLVFHIKVVAPSFEQNKAKLTTSERVRGYREPLSRRVIALLARWVSSSCVERSMVKFTHTMLTKERSTKLRLYPTLGLSIAFPAILALSTALKGSSLAAVLENIRQGNSFLMIYVSAGMLGSLTTMLFFSDSYRGGWVFGALPITDVHQLIKGATKGLVLTYITPAFLIIGVVFLPLIGLHRTLDIVVMFISSVLVATILVNMLSKRAPFSEQYIHAQTNVMGPSFAVMGIVAIIAGVHALIVGHHAVVLLLGVVLLGIVIALWNDRINSVLRSNGLALTAVVVLSVVLVTTLVGVYYQRVGIAAVDFIVENAADTLPEAFYQTVDATVLVGGDLLTIYNGGARPQMRTCFYTDDGLTVAASHTMDITPGTYYMQINDARSLRVPAELLSVGSGGVVVSGLVPPANSSTFGFSNPSDIAIGEEATLLHSEGNIQVLILGYQEIHDEQMIVLHQLDGVLQIAPGFSGSPIVQNDKIVGFLAMAIKPGFRYKGPKVGFARLATEIYLETIGSMEPVLEGGP